MRCCQWVGDGSKEEAWGMDEQRFAGLRRRHRDRDSTAVVREGGQVREVTVHDS